MIHDSPVLVLKKSSKLFKVDSEVWNGNVLIKCYHKWYQHDKTFLTRYGMLCDFCVLTFNQCCGKHFQLFWDTGVTWSLIVIVSVISTKYVVWWGNFWFMTHQSWYWKSPLNFSKLILRFEMVMFWCNVIICDNYWQRVVNVTWHCHLNKP